MPGYKIEVGVVEIKTSNFWRAVAAEFLGTLLFLVCVTTVVISSTDIVAIGIGVGLSIATLAQAFGSVSGGHLNPAVTFGMVLGGRTSFLKGCFYILAQLIGGIAGSAITYGVTNNDNRGTLGINSLAKGVKEAQGFGLELVFTFVLVFFIFSVTDEKKNVEPYGATLGIGIAIWVAHVCLVPFTGCGINPARTFGPAVVTRSFGSHWVYWVGPLLGGALSAILYNFVFYVGDDDQEQQQLEQGETVPLLPKKTSQV